jgi:hypothetical protein
MQGRSDNGNVYGLTASVLAMSVLLVRVGGAVDDAGQDFKTAAYSHRAHDKPHTDPKQSCKLYCDVILAPLCAATLGLPPS